VREVTPKSLLLDILRVSSGAVLVRDLVGIGALFELEGNAIRVALTRLGKRGLVSHDQEGYRLAADAGSLSRWVDDWRLGDKRVRAWKGAWLCVHLPRGVARTRRERSKRVLARVGFREGFEGLWVRPDNLRQPLTETLARLRELGLGDEASGFVGSEFSALQIEAWGTSLWDTNAIESACQEALVKLSESTERIAELTREQALVESFMVGGHGIRVLATDPLLPDAILSGASRRALHAAMVDYDRLGKQVWRQILGPSSLAAAPGHLADQRGSRVR